jgi:hypothetical protein
MDQNIWDQATNQINEKKLSLSAKNTEMTMMLLEKALNVVDAFRRRSKTEGPNMESVLLYPYTKTLLGFVGSLNNDSSLADESGNQRMPMAYRIARVELPALGRVIWV